VRDVPLREDAHRYRVKNGVQILATLRCLAINALRLDGIWSITEGIAGPGSRHQGLAQAAGVDRSREREPLRMTSHRPCTRIARQTRVNSSITLE